MNIWNNIRLFFSSLFQGLAAGDDVIQGQASDNGSKIIGIHQVKDIHRVSPALLRGEVTQEVAELRYRDYLVSEHSRQVDYNVNLQKDLSKPYKFTAMNHEICSSISESSLYPQPKYTLNFKYSDSVKFLLEKYCDNFSVDGDIVILRFSTLPNKNVITSKPFCNYLRREILRNVNGSLGGEYAKLKEMSFVTYKITAIPNYLKFTFQNLLLTDVEFDDLKNECILKYKANYFNIENLIEKYKVDDLDKKYFNKEEKHLPQENIIRDLNLVCEVCGSPIEYESEGKMNQSICGKFCCTKCCCNELIKKQNLE